MKELGDNNKRFRFFRRSFQFCSVIIFCLYFCQFNYICRKIALFIDSIFLIILMIWLGTKRKEIVFGNKERHLLLVFRCALNHQKNLVHKNLSLEWIIYQVKRLTNSTAKVNFSLLIFVLVFKPNAVFCYFIYRVLFWNYFRILDFKLSFIYTFKLSKTDNIITLNRKSFNTYKLETKWSSCSDILNDNTFWMHHPVS